MEAATILLEPTRRERVEAFNEVPPNPDQIWRRRTWDQGYWIARHRVPWPIIRRHLQRLGFRLHADGQVRRAPCAECGKRLDAEQLNYLRLCDTCGAGTPATICRMEREGRQLREDLKRTYTAGVPRRGPVAAYEG